MHPAKRDLAVRRCVAVLVAALVILWLALIYYKSFWGLAAATSTFLVFGTVYLAVEIEELKQSHRQVRKFVRFLFRRPLSDWIVSAALGLAAGFLVFTAAYVQVGANWSRESPEAAGTALSVFTAALAASILYRRYAPVTEWNDLLGLIIDDLTDVLAQGGHVWVVFPALSMGCHRSINDIGDIDLGSRFWKMKDLLRDCVESRDVDCVFVVYDDKLTDMLFAEYHRVVGGDGRRLERWIATERIMREERKGRPSADAADCLVRVHPSIMTNFFIVIGDATYSVQLQGFPHYLASKDDNFQKSVWKGGFIESSSEPQLVAYRRNEPGLAQQTRGELKRKLLILEGKENLANFASPCEISAKGADGLDRKGC